MNLNLDQASLRKTIKEAKDSAIKRIEDVALELQRQIEEAASVLADHPEKYTILNSDAAFIVDGTLDGYSRRVTLCLDGGRRFGMGDPDELHIPPGDYRAIVLFVKRPKVDR